MSELSKAPTDSAIHIFPQAVKSCPDEKQELWRTP